MLETCVLMIALMVGVILVVFWVECLRHPSTRILALKAAGAAVGWLAGIYLLFTVNIGPVEGAVLLVGILLWFRIGEVHRRKVQ